MSLLLILVGAALVLVGLAGCILPVLPGPPISYVGILALWWARGGDAQTFGPLMLALMGVAVVVVTVIDTIAPARGARRYGASRLGFWLSMIGLVVGTFAFPPFGMVLGALVGAWVGELLAGKSIAAALRAGWGVFVGTMQGLVLKLAVSGALAVWFVVELLA